MSESKVFGGRPGDGYSPAINNNDVLLPPSSSTDDDQEVDSPIVASESDLVELFNSNTVPHNRNNDDDDDDSSLGEDLIDLEGWNNRRRYDDTDEDDDDNDNNIDVYGVVKKKIGHLPIDDFEYNDHDDDIGVYGVVKKIFAIDDHNNNNDDDDDDDDDDNNIRNSRNNQRHGLFGRWGNNTCQGKENNNTVSTSTPYSRLGDTLNYGVDSAADDDNNHNNVDDGDFIGDNDDDDVINDEDEEEQQMDNHLRPGDHIFIWQTYGINLRAYQRHAVVYSVDKMSSTQLEEEAGVHSDQLYDGCTAAEGAGDVLSFDLDSLYDPPEDNDSNVIVMVISFYHRSNVPPGRTNNTRGSNKRKGCKCEVLLDFIGPDGLTRKKPIHKVRYGRAVKHGLLSSKAGVGTALKRDQTGLILARLRYLLDHPDDLPAHNALSANGECASLWSVTGRWCSLQGASILAVTSVGQAGGALVAGGILSQLTVLLPMPGLWGAAGWWWYVPATVAYPFLVPMLVTLGMASLLPLEILRRNRKKWRAITDGMNHDFWSLASDIIKEEYFGAMATAEREAEMRSFFGVREGDTSGIVDDARYMPLGVLGGSDGDDDNYNNRKYDEYDDDADDDDEETEALAIQRMEKKCRDMNVNLSGRPPSSRPDSGAWGSFVGSFRKKESVSARQLDDTFTETEILNTKN